MKSNVTDSARKSGQKYGGPPIHSWVHEMQSQNFDKKAHELKLVGYPLLYIPLNIPPRFAAARVAVGRGPYFVNVLRILRPANSLQKSPPSISFQNPPPRQLSVLNSLLCVQPSPSGFRAEFFTVCPVWSIELSQECLKESLPPRQMGPTERGATFPRTKPDESKKSSHNYF